MKTVVVLNNIRSNENVGSIFRTCDAAGVSKIYLVGITPAPLDRFDRINSGLAKAALGAEEFVEWTREESLAKAIEKLKDEKMVRLKIVGVEQDERAIDYRDFAKKLNKKEKIAFVFGNEVEGLSKEDLKLCGQTVEIPMHGKKESLNVAVTVGIILFQSCPR